MAYRYLQGRGVIGEVVGTIVPPKTDVLHQDSTVNPQFTLCYMYVWDKNKKVRAHMATCAGPHLVHLSSFCHILPTALEKGR